MLRKVLKISAHPRLLLRSVLALDDSPHAIALGVAVGIFFGLTPTVGVQTILILAIVFLSRRICYFNGAAAMAATYISNPFTMAPMYYFWYRLGSRFVPGNASMEQVRSLLQVDGIGQWFDKVCAIGADVGLPMCVGALLTAPFGALLAYPACYWLLKWSGHNPKQKPPERESTDGQASDAGSPEPEGEHGDSDHDVKDETGVKTGEDQQSKSEDSDASGAIKSPCLAV
ncbi:DUF2062 domain-containing protein [Fuerstiella marisgermanici]|uniref:DUF2062 domain-containing protein n=1 Tax=Fuerstiella marisgermanici TaxID=1891926 RepID=A0A1P8WEZ6_9PLAN|nr:DUF2062 domain-containing protein [Fuerstiella marisgermanici]APZ92634.1 hypothetical protein Fuma_02245 [Fuerstiella marisgermanici]